MRCHTSQGWSSTPLVLLSLLFVSLGLGLPGPTAAQTGGYRLQPIAGQPRVATRALPKRGQAAGAPWALRAASARRPASHPRLLVAPPARARAAAAAGKVSARALGSRAQRDGAAAKAAGGARIMAPFVEDAGDSIDKGNCDCSPADAGIAAGRYDIVTAANTAWIAFDKLGTPITDEIQLWDWFAPVYDNPDAIYDQPRVLYDQYRNRYVLIAIATDYFAGESVVLVSVSPYAAADGEWILYAIDATLNSGFATNNFINSPGLGVDSRAIYIAGNMFDFDTDFFQYAKVLVLDKNRLYSGILRGFTVWEIVDAFGEPAFSIQPAHNFGTASTGFLISARFTGNDVVSGMTVWQVSNPTYAPRLRRRWVPTGAYAAPLPGYQPEDIDAGLVSDTLLDLGDGRLHNAAYRSGFLYTAHATDFDWGDNFPVAAVHYLQISTRYFTPVRELYYGAPELDYSYPVIMPDAYGNLAITFNRSAWFEFASLRVTGRQRFNSGSLLQDSVVLAEGGSQLLQGADGLAYLGHWNGIALDPRFPDTWWFYGMYATDLEDFWSTRIGVGGF